MQILKTIASVLRLQSFQAYFDNTFNEVEVEDVGEDFDKITTALQKIGFKYYGNVNSTLVISRCYQKDEYVINVGINISSGRCIIKDFTNSRKEVLAAFRECKVKLTDAGFSNSGEKKYCFPENSHELSTVLKSLTAIGYSHRLSNRVTKGIVRYIFSSTIPVRTFYIDTQAGISTLYI